MSFWEFASNSPWLTFFLVLILSELVIRIVVTLPNRILRHRNIKLHGYPPKHCDADGDFVNIEEAKV